MRSFFLFLFFHFIYLPFLNFVSLLFFLVGKRGVCLVHCKCFIKQLFFSPREMVIVRSHDKKSIIRFWNCSLPALHNILLYLWFPINPYSPLPIQGVNSEVLAHVDINSPYSASDWQNPQTLIIIIYCYSFFYILIPRVLYIGAFWIARKLGTVLC